MQTSLSEKLKACASGEGANQYAMDLISTFALMQSGFVSNPRFNELVKLADPKAYYELVRDEFRQINTYILERCMEHDVIPASTRFTDEVLRNMLVEFGIDYAELTFMRKKLPNWDEAKALFDRQMKTHYHV